MKQPPPRKPKCKICYDKGYSTRMYQVIGSPDFPGDKGFISKPKIEKKICNCQIKKITTKKQPRICEHEEELIAEALSIFFWIDKLKFEDIDGALTRYLNTHVCKKCKE